MIGSDAWGADVRHLDAAGCPVRHSSSGPPPTRGPPTRPHLGPLHTPRRCGRGPPPSGRPGRSSTPGSPRSPAASCG